MSQAAPARLAYPQTRRGDAKDEYFGTVVEDPYQWLEKPDDPAVQEWVSSQNAVTNAFLAQCPAKKPLEERLKAVYNYERFTCPWRRGDKVFFYRNSGLQNQAVLYKQNGLQGKEEILLDPNTLAADGTAALGAVAITKDGSMMAYGVQRAGSDWTTVSVMRVEDNAVQEDKLEWVKFSGLSWTHDRKGFFYSRYPTPVEFKSSAKDAADGKEQPADDLKRGTETSAVRDHAVYYHVLGTSQDADQLVLQAPADHREWTVGGSVSDDGKWLLLELSDGCDTKNRLYVSELNADYSYSADVKSRIIKLIDVFEAQYEYICNEGSKFWLRTNLQADTYRVVSVDVSAPFSHAGLTTVIPAHERDVLAGATIVAGDKLVVEWSRDVQGVLSLYDLTGKLVRDKFDLPDVGAIAGLTARKEDQSFFYSFTSFLSPGMIYSVDLTRPTEEQQTLFREIKIAGFDASAFTTKQVFYASKDGTKIPMFIVHRKGVVLDGSNPTWLYGYGGFNIPLPPSFSVARVVWMSHFSGIFACANIRGGGEYGESWRQGGILQRKKNCFDDFIAAAEYLIDNKYTSPPKLAINGGSNGGLLVAACVNARPDLFGAAIAAVGVLDMLKFHQWTIGHAWASDYGNSSQSKEMFEYLRSYSPVHNVTGKQVYPAVLLCTSDHDDRVVPLHSYKYISELQSRVAPLPEQTAPLLIRVEEKAGHGAGLPLSKRIVEQADVMAFMAKVLGATGKF